MMKTANSENMVYSSEVAKRALQEVKESMKESVSEDSKIEILRHLISAWRELDISHWTNREPPQSEDYLNGLIEGKTHIIYEVMKVLEVEL